MFGCCLLAHLRSHLANHLGKHLTDICYLILKHGGVGSEFLELVLTLRILAELILFDYHLVQPGDLFTVFLVICGPFKIFFLKLTPDLLQLISEIAI